MISPVKEMLSALQDLKTFHPITKMKAKWVLDELESLGGFQKSLELLDLDEEVVHDSLFYYGYN